MQTEQQLQQKTTSVEEAFTMMADSLRGMQAKELRISALQKVVRLIRAPILKQGRAVTAELRLEVSQLTEKIEAKEKPFRDDADSKTKDLRDTIKAERDALKGIKSALYNAVNPPAEVVTQPSQA